MNQNILNKLTNHFRKFAEKKYPKGKIITFANQEPKGVSFLLEGVVEQYDITQEGNKVIVNIFKPPSFFPMSWAINRVPNTYFYAALTDVTLKQADADVTLEFLQSNPDVMFDLLSRVYKGTDTILQRMVLASRGIASNRLIFELLIEAYRFGKEIDKDTTLVSIKHNALAARTGLARETISRELHKLEKKDALSISREGIMLHTNHLEEMLSINI